MRQLNIQLIALFLLGVLWCSPGVSFAQTVPPISITDVGENNSGGVWVDTVGVTAQTTVQTADVNGNVLATYPSSALALYPAQNLLTFALSTLAEQTLVATRGIIVVVTNQTAPGSAFLFQPVANPGLPPVVLNAAGQGGPNNYSLWITGTGLTADSIVTVRSQYGWTYEPSGPKYVTRQTNWQTLNTYPNEQAATTFFPQAANNPSMQTLTLPLVSEAEQREFTLWGLVVTVQDPSGSFATITLPPRTPDTPFPAAGSTAWGVNIYGLLKQTVPWEVYYGGNSQESAAEAQVWQQMSVKAVANAFHQGAKVVSFFASGAYPSTPAFLAAGLNDLALWQTEPDAYWHRFDQALAEIARYGMAADIRGFGDLSIFPVLANAAHPGHYETNADMMGNPNSYSYQMFQAYWGELLGRYAGAPYVALVEAPNEMNNSADLDQQQTCAGNYDNCITNLNANNLRTMAGNAQTAVTTCNQEYSPNVTSINACVLATQKSQTFPDWINNCLTSADYVSGNMANLLSGSTAPQTGLAGFNTTLVNFFHSVDPNRKIGSNNSVPRQAAFVLNQHPQWSGANINTPDICGQQVWGPDAGSQMYDVFSLVNGAFDVIDAHVYNGGDWYSYLTPNIIPNGGVAPLYINYVLTTYPCNLITPPINVFDASTIYTLASWASFLKKPLFLGEFGDADPLTTDDNTTTLTDTNRTFTRNVIAALDGDGPTAIGGTVWGYEMFADGAPYLFRVGNPVAGSLVQKLSAGDGNLLMPAIAAANVAKGQTIYTPPSPNTVPPQVLITWPLPGASISGASPSTIFVTASAATAAGTIVNVSLTIGGTSHTLQPYSTANTPAVNYTYLQYGYTPTAADLGQAKLLSVQVRATDQAGNVGTAATSLLP